MCVATFFFSLCVCVSRSCLCFWLNVIAQSSFLCGGLDVMSRLFVCFGQILSKKNHML